MSIIDVRDDILALDFEYDISIVLACQNILYVINDYFFYLINKEKINPKQYFAFYMIEPVRHF